MPKLSACDKCGALGWVLPCSECRNAARADDPPCIADDHYPNDDGTACYYCGLPAETVAPDDLAAAWARVASGLPEG